MGDFQGGPRNAASTGSDLDAALKQVDIVESRPSTSGWEVSWQQLLKVTAKIKTVVVQ